MFGKKKIFKCLNQKTRLIYLNNFDRHKNTLEFRNVQSELSIKDRTRLHNFMRCFIPERK